MGSWVPGEVGRRAFQRAGDVGLANSGYNMTFTDQANITTSTKAAVEQQDFITLHLMYIGLRKSSKTKQTY